MAQELTEVEYPNCFGSYYRKDEVDAVLAEKDNEIERLDDLAHAHNIELLRKENLIAEKDASIAELKNEINRKEGVGQRWFKRCMEARTENVRLKRALYKACANWAKSERYTEATWHGDEHREELWAEVQDKCLKKAEEY